ncbi:hypothetical protein [Actinomadura geliboluensis]|uniref:hypothetical protein n=1 Tax=Actinomadura geliboluensis TaxID=882440 RepID=UPI0036BBE411
MVYSDKPGRRIFRPPRRRVPPADAAPNDAKVRYILEVAAEYPKATPAEIYTVIRQVKGRHDITKAMVRRVLRFRRTPSQRRFGR